MPATRPLVLLGVLLFTLSALAAPAGAQIPQQACTTLTLSHTTPSPIAHGTPAELVETVSNTGQFEAVVTVTAALDVSGWSVEPREHQVTVAAGAQETVTFIITPPTEGQEHAASFSVDASGFCSAAGNAGPFPTATASDPVELQWAAPEGVGLPIIGNIPPVYLLGGVAALGVVIGAVLLLVRKDGGFTVRAPEGVKKVTPGASVSFPLEIRNPVYEPDTASLLLSSVPPGWSAFTATPDVRLGGGESRTVYVMVRAPEDAQAGDGVNLVVDVRSEGSPGGGRTVELKAEVAATPEREEAGPAPA